MSIAKCTTNNTPPISKEELERLKNISDDEIDFSDIPEVTDFSNWMTVQEADKFRKELYRNRKQAVSIRLDKDILLWLKSEGQGYQTRINQILRNEMEKNCTLHKRHDTPLKTKTNMDI